MAEKKREFPDTHPGDDAARLDAIRAFNQAQYDLDAVGEEDEDIRFLLSVIDRLTAERDEAISTREGIGDTEIRRLIRERDEYRNQVRELRKERGAWKAKARR